MLILQTFLLLILFPITYFRLLSTWAGKKYKNGTSGIKVAFYSIGMTVVFPITHIFLICLYIRDKIWIITFTANNSLQNFSQIKVWSHFLICLSHRNLSSLASKLFWHSLDNRPPKHRPQKNNVRFHLYYWLIITFNYTLRRKQRTRPFPLNGCLQSHQYDFNYDYISLT